MINKFLNKYNIELAYSVLLLFILIRICPTYLELQDFWRSYIANYYVLSYNTTGEFVARGLIGSITEFLFPYINSKVFYFTFLCIYYFTYLVIGFSIIRYAKNILPSNRVFVLVTIIMCNPATLNYPLDFARPDFFLALITILIFSMIRHNKFIIATPILCIIGILIHEGFIVLFVPTIATFLLYKVAATKDRKYIITIILLIVCCLGSFIATLKFGKNYYENYNEIQSQMQEHTDIPLNPNMLSFEHGSMKYELKDVSANELSQYKTIVALFFYTLIFVPLFILYFKLFNQYKTIIKNKFVIMLYKIAPFSGLLMIIAGVDYGRWYSMSVTCLLIHAYYYITDESNHLKSENIPKEKDHSILYAFLMVMYLTIGPMGDIHEHFDYLNKLNSLYNIIFYGNTVNF